MMSKYIEEEIQNIRRISERGLKAATSQPKDNSYIDIFQHILDTLQRIQLDE